MNTLKYLLIFCILAVFSLEIKAQTVIISKDKNKQIMEWVQWHNPSAKIFEFYYLNADSQNLLINQATHIIIGGGEDIQDVIMEEVNFRVYAENQIPIEIVWR